MPYDPFTGSWYDSPSGSSVGVGTAGNYRYNPFDDPVSERDDLLLALQSSYETPSLTAPTLSIPEPEEPSFFENLGRLGQSFGSGIAGAAGSLIGAAEGALGGGISNTTRALAGHIGPFADPIADFQQSLLDPIAQAVGPALQQGRYAAENVAQMLSPEREEGLIADVRERPFMAIAERGAEALPAMASMIGVGGALGPGAGAAAGGLLEFGGAYGQNVDAGVDPERAAATAQARAVAVGLLDRIGLGAILGKTGTAAAQEAVPLLAQMGRAALAEGAPEVGQEAIGMAEEAINGRIPTWEEIQNRLLTAGTLGALMGSGMAGALGGGGSPAVAPPVPQDVPSGAPVAPVVEPDPMLVETAMGLPQDTPTQSVPMAGDASTALLPQMPYDETSPIPPEMLGSETAPLPEEAIRTQPIPGPLPTIPSVEPVAPQNPDPVIGYVPEAVRRDLEEARAILARQKEERIARGETTDPMARLKPPKPGAKPAKNFAPVNEEYIQKIVAQDQERRRIEEALDSTTDGREEARAPVGTPQPAPVEPAPLPTPKPQPKVETPPPTPSAPLDETVGPVPAEAVGIQARVVGGLEEALQNAKPVLKKWGTSLGVLSRPARNVVEGARNQRTASKDTALEIGNAITRLTVAEVKAGRWKRADLDAAINAYIDGETPARPLPATLQKVADAARQIVMPLQRRQAAVLRAQGRPELAKTFQSNVGKRHTRAYRVFDDPKHVAKLRETGEWDRLKGEIAKLPDMKGKSADEVETFMRQMTDRDPLSLDARKGGGLGTAYEGIYQQRQDLAEPIRKLLGEYTEPGERIFRTVDRLQRNVATYEMYSDFKKIGIKEGWLSEKATKEAYKELPGKESRSPIGGLYATPEMYEIITASDPELSTNLVMKVLQYTTGAVKANKTVASVQSANRNVESNVLLHAANGNFLGARFMPWNNRPGALPIGVRKSFWKLRRTSSGRGTVKDVLRAEKEGRLESYDPLEARRYIEERVKYGIFDQAPDVKDIEFFFGPDGPLNMKKSVGAKGLEEVKRYAQHYYRLGDGGYKDDAWQQEQNRLAWYHEGDKKWTPDRIKAVAADRVKDSYPTSARQPKWVQELRRQPVIGGFVSFYLDIPRNVKNIVKLGIEEVTEGRKTGNKRMVLSGAQRLGSVTAGVAAMEAALLAVKAARSALADEKDKPKRTEELMFRPFLPEYMHNSRTPVLARGRGWAYVADMSFMDPWAMLKKPVTAMMRSLEYDEKGIDRAVWEGFRELIGPVAQEGMVIGPFAEAFWYGRDKNGRRIWYDNEDAGVKFMKAAAYVAKRWEPGTATTAKRIGKAVQSGDIRAIATEVGAVFGPRVMLMDMDEQMPLLAGRFEQGQRDATSVFNRTLRPERTDDERRSELRSALSMYRASVKDLIAGIETARELNLTRREIERLLDNAGLSDASIKLAFQGEDAMLAAYKKKLQETYRAFRANPSGWRDDR